MSGIREVSRKEAGAGLKEASDYVTSMSIRSFLEYISVELLTALPVDPFIFTRNLLDLKVAERINSDYDPANMTDYLKTIYSEIAEHGDEHGRIPRRVFKGSNVSTDEVEMLTARAQKYEALMRAACELLSNLGAREMQESVVQNCTALFEADRAHLFVHREASHDLVSRTGPSELIVPVGKGVVGSVAATGEVVNLKDAYDDPRFDDLLDRMEGYRSHTVLAVPVKALDGRLLGVVHATNRPHSFSQLDEEVMTAYAQLVGVAMANVARHEELSVQGAKLRSVLDCVSGLQPDLGGKHLLRALSATVPTLIPAERCLCYHVDHRKGQLVGWTGPAGIPVKVPLGKGVSGLVASTGQLLRVQDPDKDPRFVSTEDPSSEKPLIRNTLSLPIHVSTTVLGVLELSNQSETGLYTPADEDLMTRLAAAVSPILLAALKSGADNLEAPRLEVVE